MAKLADRRAFQMKPKTIKVAPPEESKKPVPEGYVLVRLDRKTGRGFYEILVSKDEFNPNPSFAKTHNAMVRKQKRDLKKTQDNSCAMPNEPADHSYIDDYDKANEKAKMMRFIKRVIKNMKSKEMRRNIKVSITVLLTKKNVNPLLDSFIPDEERENDDKAIDLKIMESKEVASKGKDFVLYRIEADSRKSVYDLFYKGLSTKKDDYEHIGLIEMLSRFNIKEFKALGFNMLTGEQERLDYAENQVTSYVSTIATDFWSKQKVESDLGYVGLMKIFKNKEVNDNA